MAKRKKTFFEPLIRCGCPRMPFRDNKGALFEDCTCFISSPKTARRERYLAPRGEYVLFVTSNKDPKLTGWKPFITTIKRKRRR